MNKKNHLYLEKSPYLLQHKDNPVHWFGWGEEAFRVAREENKPVFLSIGYSTCYWCHVMEKDSFEHDDVAEILNEHFVSIKVDREERPDVDKIYMDAVTALTGHGGWPMSVFLTPEGKPFFGGTFFYRDQFKKLITQLHEAWSNSHDDVCASAEQLTVFLNQQIDEVSGANAIAGAQVFNDAVEQLSARYDTEWGGFGGAPKFPPSGAIGLLLRIVDRTGNAKASEMLTGTLEKMARGGLYDHLGGGFHRYSTDSKWLVPHFEKMLYDNALLATTYIEAFQVTQKPMFAAVARETLDYLVSQMMQDGGGFFSAEDAGEVGKEGEFYVWSDSELQDVLTPSEYLLIQGVYGVTAEGNFEGNNVLNLSSSAEWEVKELDELKQVHKKLLAVRTQRKPVLRDEKILAAWNGLAVAALAKGHSVLGDARYLAAAESAARFLKEKMFRANTLYRSYYAGDARLPGYLDDYAFVIQGLIQLYRANFDVQWLNFAFLLQEIQDKVFWDEEEGGYFFTRADDSLLIARRKDLFDGPKPSGNGVAVLNLLHLFGYSFEKSFQQKAQVLLKLATPLFQQYPSAVASLLVALDFWHGPSFEVAIVGTPQSETTKEAVAVLQRGFYPRVVFGVGAPAAIDDVSVPALFRGKVLLNENATLYVCKRHDCKLPTAKVETMVRMLQDAGNDGPRH